jgi:carboxymethylenebutenolidase
MKNNLTTRYSILTTILILWSSVALAQQKMSCCQSPDALEATDQFAQFASNKSFNSNHPEPLDYKHISQVGKMITFEGSDGQVAAAYELRAAEETDNWIFVFHEWWGLNEYIKKESEKLYNDLGNVNVLAIDLYEGKVAKTQEQASHFMQMVNTERGRAIIEGALDYVGDYARIGTIGWCFGGGWSLQAAIIAENQAYACVMYYGMPERNLNRLDELECPVLGIFAKNDTWINTQVVRNFEDDMDELSKDLRIRSYEADHAFANPSNPNYNSMATRQAYQETLSFFRSELLY